MNDLVTTFTALGLVLSPALLKLADAATDSDAADDEAPRRMCVDEDDAPVHRKFRGRGDIATHLEPGDVVHVVSERANWKKVIYAQAGRAEVGWMVDKYVESCETGPTAPAGSEGIVASSVASIDDLPQQPPQEGTYRIHLIDVGTGLAVLVQGADFNLLYDGGSSDDKATGKNSRLVAYLFAALGPSGDEDCVPAGDPGYDDYAGDAELTIDHVFLSHPHDDHGSMLDDVLRCYAVANVWDAGIVNDAVFYRDFVEGVAAEEGVHYHTAAEVPGDRTVTIVDEDVFLPPTVEWSTFAADASLVELGAGAGFRVLQADAEDHGSDLNMNSIVVRVELGDRSLLLTGDEEAGARDRWDDGAPEAGTPEAALLAAHLDLLQVDILQVPHHGSVTSSRRDFLEAVRPQWALIGDGPKKFSGVDLPDAQVIDALTEVLGTTHESPAETRLLVTNAHDASGCPIDDRIGRNDQANPGGCDSYLLELSN